jgi:hypothetical protein
MEAVMAQAQQMAEARAAGLRPGQMPPQGGASPKNSIPGNEQGNTPSEVAFNLEKLPDLKSMSLKDWGDLPLKVAEELLESERENLSPEFRKQIHHYFLRIGKLGRARQATSKKK